MGIDYTKEMGNKTPHTECETCANVIIIIISLFFFFVTQLPLFSTGHSSKEFLMEFNILLYIFLFIYDFIYDFIFEQQVSLFFFFGYSWSAAGRRLVGLLTSQFCRCLSLCLCLCHCLCQLWRRLQSLATHTFFFQVREFFSRSLTFGAVVFLCLLTFNLLCPN